MADLKVYKVTKKGQFTIPKKLREKYQIKDKILMEEGKQGIVIKPLASSQTDLDY